MVCSTGGQAQSSAKMSLKVRRSRSWGHKVCGSHAPVVRRIVQHTKKKRLNETHLKPRWTQHPTSRNHKIPKTHRVFPCLSSAGSRLSRLDLGFVASLPPAVCENKVIAACHRFLPVCRRKRSTEIDEGDDRLVPLSTSLVEWQTQGEELSVAGTSV